MTAAEDNRPSPPPRWLRLLPPAAFAAAMTFGVLLGVRPLTSPDLGYHLAYGQEFLDHGRIADHNPYIYTVDPSLPPDKRPAPGPGCWYDSAGRYRFANANWLTQVVYALVARAGGLVALCVFQSAMVAGVFVLAAVCMRRLGLSWTWTAAGVLLVAMVSYERFILRPEMSSFLILLAQACLLLPAHWRFLEAGPAARPVIGWRTVLALVALQLLLVNMHSYFLIGLAMTGAMLADAVLRRLGALAGQAPRGADEATRRHTQRLGVLLAAQTAACFVNPWTWRLALLPIQTVAFLRRNHIGEKHNVSGHPWAIIGEFLSPFAEAYAHTKATWAFYVLLGAATLAIAAALARRRWAVAILLAGMGSVALSMRRNIAPAGMLMWPAILATLSAATARLRPEFRERVRPWAKPIAAGGVLLLSAWFSVRVVTQRFYYSERSNARFGWYLARIDLPLAMAEWVDRHDPAGRVWTDYTSSSNFHYFTRPHRDVPTLTNTWAYPPDTMAEVLDYMMGVRPFALAEEQYGPECVAMKVDNGPELAKSLVRDPAWRLVYLDGIYAIFLRARDAAGKPTPNAALAERLALPADHIDDMPAFLERCRRLDPVPAYGAHLAGLTLYMLGWDNSTVEAYREAIRLDPRYFRSWQNLGVCLGRRGRSRAAGGDVAGARKDWQEAVRCFRTALECGPRGESRRDIEKNLRIAESDLRSLR